MPEKIKLGDDLFTVEALTASEAFDLQPIVWPPALEVIRTWLQLGSDAKVQEAYEKMVERATKQERDKSAKKDAPKTDAEKMATLGDLDMRDTADLIAACAPTLVLAVANVFTQLPREQLKLVRTTLLQGARMNGQPLFSPKGNIFDEVMRGRTLDTWRLLLMALRVNYADFFGLAGAMTGRKANGSESPTG